MHPAAPKTKTLKEIWAILDNHYIKKTNKRAERFKFNKISQESGESLSDFLARIREAASWCELNFAISSAVSGAQLQATLTAKLLEDHILDRFVMGLKNSRIQQTLLEEDPEILSAAYDKARTMQMAFEEKSVNAEVNVIKHHPRHSKNYQNYNKRNHRTGGSKAVSSPCNHRTGRRKARSNGSCGRDSHPLEECPAKIVTCHQCKKTGHFSRWCKSKGTEVISSVAINNNSAVRIGLQINGQEYNFLVDSGASTNFISNKLFNNNFATSDISPYSDTIRD